MDFVTGRVVTQGNLIYPMIFNIVVDVVVSAVWDLVCSPQEAQHGMVWEAGKWNLVFYDDGGRIAGRDHIWEKDSLTVTLEMFRRVSLETNLKKTKALVCTPV